MQRNVPLLQYLEYNQLLSLNLHWALTSYFILLCPSEWDNCEWIAQYLMAQLTEHFFSGSLSLSLLIQHDGEHVGNERQ